jgi:uncharacterized protein (DUF2062 family)
MPRKFFRRFLPDHDKVRANRWFGRLAVRFSHPNLWCLNRGSVSGGLAIGLFAGLIPGPFQMLGAALLAIPLKKNLPVALVTTLYTNPLTIVPLYLLAYAYGNLLLGGGAHHVDVAPLLWDWTDLVGSSRELMEWTFSLGKPLAVGLIALALTLASAGYFAVQIGWRIYVGFAWRARARRRKVHRGKTTI